MATAVQVLLPVLLLTLSTLAMTVPDRPVVQRLAADVASGAYGPNRPRDGFGGRQDRFSECIAATQGVALSGHYGPWERTVLSPRLSSCGTGAALIEQLAAQGGPAPGPRDTNLEYARYWHGYAVVSRPLIALGGLTAARVASGVLLAVATVALGVAVHRRRGPLAAAALLIPLLVSTNTVTTPLAYHQALAMAVALGGAAVTVLAGGRAVRLPALAVGSGGLFAYVDFLSTPALAWAATAVAAALTAPDDADGRERARRWLAGVAGWPVGYALTWAAKWLVVGLVAGFDRIGRDVVEVGSTRLDGTAGGEVDLSPGAAVAECWARWMSVPAAPWVAWACGLLLVIGLVLACRRRTFTVEPALVLLSALLVPAWFEVLKNHSQIHAFFTYRGLGLAAGCCALSAVLLTRRTRAPYGTRAPRRDQPSQR